MPSEKKNKRNKVENKASTSNESLKPLSSYVSDRLELTKQLFSCLKNKQIKSRLPPSLQVRLSEIVELNTFCNWLQLMFAEQIN